MGILQLFLAPVYKFLSNLSGISLESSEFPWGLVCSCGDNVIETAMYKNELLYVHCAFALSLAESVFTRDFVKAANMMLKYRTFFQMLDEQQLRITESDVIFLAGLVSFHMARETREPCWIEKGTNALTVFENWSNVCEWNFKHKYWLLKAELHHTQGETDAAVRAYDESVETARKHRFIHHEAVACELAAYFFGNNRAKKRTREMIQKSYDAYIEWGAETKAKSVIRWLELQYFDGSET